MSKADKAKARKRRKVWVPGRKRKDGGRKPSGDIRQQTRRETIDQVQSVAKKNPDRRWAPDPLSPHLDWGIGKLFLTGQIDVEQNKAALEYLERKARYHAAVDAQKETAQAIDMAKERSGGSPWAVAIFDPEQIAAHQAAIAEWDRMQDVLADHSRVLFGWSNYKRLGETLRRAVMESDVRDVGEIRQALNVLVRLWKPRGVSVW